MKKCRIIKSHTYIYGGSIREVRNVNINVFTNEFCDASTTKTFVEEFIHDDQEKIACEIQYPDVADHTVDCLLMYTLFAFHKVFP